jgi:hypothetical protein
MARHCIREPRYIPPVHVIGEQPDMFGGPTISHAAERKPVGAKALRAIAKWAVAPWLGDVERVTTLEEVPAPVPVYLVACVAAKLDQAAEARDLYTSPWFRKVRAYVERTGSPWLILSAKHGLLAPGAIIEPYDETISAMGAPARRLWGARVLDELARVVVVAAPLIVLAGRSYRDPLWPSIAPRATAPMEGLGIGEQLAWLSRRPGAEAGVSSSAFPDTVANGDAHDR